MWAGNVAEMLTVIRFSMFICRLFWEDVGWERLRLTMIDLCLSVDFFGRMWAGNVAEMLTVIRFSNKWGYDFADGPTFWPKSYPNCGGQQQSPISIGVSEVVVNNSLPHFNFDHIKNVTNLKMTLENNGHSVQIDLKGNNLQLSGGGLPGTFNAEQFHFHWGSEDKRGSEHNINGKQYPMEMHVVLFNSKYGMFSNALNKTEGLAVLAFLFEIGETNHHFDEIISHLTKISHKDDHALLNTFALDSLFPHDAGVYYRYYGSLTTPPCYESVIWTIFKNHIVISEEQIEKFRHQVHRNYANETDRDISDDYRPIQRLNNRVDPHLCDNKGKPSGVHLAISSRLKFSNPPKQRKTVTFWKYRDIVVKDLITDLNNSAVLCNPEGSSDELVKVYNSEVQIIIDKHASLQTKDILLRPNTQWYTDELHAAKRERRKAERQVLGHSTETALLRGHHDIVLALDNNCYAILVVLDLSAAFDTINHPILINRLEYSSGITGSALSWMRSYLDSRTQRVAIGSVLSDVLTINMAFRKVPSWDPTCIVFLQNRSVKYVGDTTLVAIMGMLMTLKST
ncbi:CA [Mytilus coruscus]|uniref:Carbonic anhydrase n=1 Tax=Mytilus coruscus TaxID=42192 RepID=A0A6J8B9A8_MYTCO|nr:CA [Mytilus coruscus]